MSLLDDARRLAALDPFCDTGYIDTVWECVGCSIRRNYSKVHAADCPTLSMPKIVAVLEAAERLISWPMMGEPSEEYGTERIYVFCRGDANNDAHAEDCRYQALVAALRGERVTA